MSSDDKTDSPMSHSGKSLMRGRSSGFSAGRRTLIVMDRLVGAPMVAYREEI